MVVLCLLFLHSRFTAHQTCMRTAKNKNNVLLWTYKFQEPQSQFSKKKKQQENSECEIWFLYLSLFEFELLCSVKNRSLHQKTKNRIRPFIQ